MGYHGLSTKGPFPMTDVRAQEIRLGQAINLAMQYAHLSGSVTSPEDAVALADEALPTFLEFINKTQLKLTSGLVQTTPITAAPSFQPPVQHPSQAAPQPMAPPAPPQAQPAPVPGLGQGGNTKKDAAWRDYFANPGAYYDNRVDKQNPNGPDFKHKQTKEGLWLGGRYPAPAWVLQQLGMTPVPAGNEPF